SPNPQRTAAQNPNCQLAATTRGHHHPHHSSQMAGFSSTTHTYLDGPFHPAPRPGPAPTATSHYRLRHRYSDLSTSALQILIMFGIMGGLFFLALIIEAVKSKKRRRRQLEEGRNRYGIELHDIRQQPVAPRHENRHGIELRNIRQQPVAPRHDHDDGTAAPPSYSGPSPRTESGPSVINPDPTPLQQTEGSTSVVEPEPLPPPPGTGEATYRLTDPITGLKHSVSVINPSRDKEEE
ncbi:hypothetical protein F4680DRAFT_470722, partial [Xylaria scruposa]